MKKPGEPGKSTQSTLDGGTRRMKQRVKVEKGRTPSSKRWLDRQLNDPYVAAAREGGFRSRAAFKLMQINEQYKLLKLGMRIVDLGATPGGWSQIAAQAVGSAPVSGVAPHRSKVGRVIAIDINEMEPLAGVVFEQLDFSTEGADAKVEALLHGERADGVLTDMAEPATGHRQTDHLRIMALCELALEFARDVLKPGGFFLAKVLQGGTQGSMLANLKKDFALVRHVKPEASRKDSSELYVLATGFRGETNEGQL